MHRICRTAWNNGQFFLAAPLIIYSLTLAPSVLPIDTGELAAVQALAGIAHPTGYPLFTLLGYFFSLIPLPLSVIRQLNLLSLFWTVLGISGFMVSSSALIKLYRERMSSQAIPRRDGLFLGPAVGLSGLFFSFHPTVWIQSTSIEVYSLHIGILGWLFFMLIKAFRRKEPGYRPWAGVMILLGLGAANHMTILLVIPGIFYLMILDVCRKKLSIADLLRLSVLFVAVFSLLYLYLPLRASQQPVLNWGDPSNFPRFIRHITGRQYRIWMFSSSEIAWTQLYHFIRAFAGRFSFTGLAFGLFGVTLLFLCHRPWAVWSLITFIGSVAYAVNYDIHDIESYYLTAYMVFGFWIALGMYRLFIIVRKRTWLFLGALSVTMAGLIVQIVTHWTAADMSRNYACADYTKAALHSLPPNSILLTYQWDTLVSPALYFQHVEKYRPDLLVVDKELLRRSWYYSQLARWNSDIAEENRIFFDEFIHAVKPFESGKPYDAARIERQYRRVITQLMETGLQRGGTFLAPELIQGELRRGEIILPAGTYLIPHHFFFQLTRTAQFVPLERQPVRIRIPAIENPYLDRIRGLTGQMWLWRSMYALQNENVEEARWLADQIIRHFPSFPLPESLRRLRSGG